MMIGCSDPIEVVDDDDSMMTSCRSVCMALSTAFESECFCQRNAMFVVIRET